MAGSVASYFQNWDLQLLCGAFVAIGYILSKKPFRIYALKSLLPKLVASSALLVWRLLAFTLILAARQRCELYWSKLVCVTACPLGLGNLIGIWLWLWLGFLEERGVHVVVMCLQGFCWLQKKAENKNIPKTHTHRPDTSKLLWDSLRCIWLKIDFNVWLPNIYIYVCVCVHGYWLSFYSYWLNDRKVLLQHHQ